MRSLWIKERMPRVVDDVIRSRPKILEKDLFRRLSAVSFVNLHRRVTSEQLPYPFPFRLGSVKVQGRIDD